MTIPSLNVPYVVVSPSSLYTKAKRIQAEVKEAHNSHVFFYSTVLENMQKTQGRTMMIENNNGWLHGCTKISRLRTSPRKFAA